MADPIKERELVLSPTEYAMVLDETKGFVATYVGPFKTSLSPNDSPVVWDEKAGTFKRCEIKEAVKVFPFAGEGSYMVLTNPSGSMDSKLEHPTTGNSNTPTLQIGRKINIPGPMSFPLWPSQTAKIIAGHIMRSNQYLVVRVYNETEARKNWLVAVTKPQAPVAESKPATESNPPEEGQLSVDAAPEVPHEEKEEALTMGQILIIKGTDVSFYIPPTGIEIVPDDSNFVRDAVTLERLEYCILLDEDGNKRFVQGPAVVFPKPTETFVEDGGHRKFKAIELNKIMGIYIKVIADYEDGQIKRKAGDELFITGDQQTIYYPRQEHAIIRYGEDEIHYAIAIPEGEARYVLNRNTGKVDLVEGPRMFIPDPRTQVVVRRLLDKKTVNLWYPGNEEAVRYNTELAALTSGKSGEPIKDRDLGGRSGSMLASTLMGSRETAKSGFTGDEFDRKPGFTPPRTITLNTKYDGAPAINVWTGYAVQIVSKTGDRRVVLGPKSILLKYDETLEVLTMSTGTPKSDDKTIQTVYLLAQNNRVSDIVEVETGDMVPVKIRVSYRVNFEGPPEKWFAVDNYVRLLTEHLRSLIRNAAKQHGIEAFNAGVISIVRDTVLGIAAKEGDDVGKRPGRSFSENGMRVYDLEVLNIQIGNSDISEMLRTAQYETVKQALEIAGKERTLKVVQRGEKISQDTLDAKAATAAKQFELAQDGLKRDLQRVLVEAGNRVAAVNAELEAKLKQQQVLGTINDAELARSRAREDQRIQIATDELDVEIAKLNAEAAAIVERAKALGPEVVAALQAFADKDLAARMAESMGPLAIVNGKSVVDVLNQLTKGTIIEGILNKVLSSAPADKQ